MKVFSVWALPTGTAETSYQSVIDNLARRVNAPTFRPHVTLGSVDHQIDLEGFADGMGPTIEVPLSLQFGSTFTRSLIVQLKMTDWFRTMRERLEVRSGFASSRVFDPHISLCYGAPPSGAATLPVVRDLIDEPVELSRLALMEITLPVETYEDVCNWREVSLLTLM